MKERKAKIGVMYVGIFIGTTYRKKRKAKIYIMNLPITVIYFRRLRTRKN